MGQSLSNVMVHLVFSTKSRMPWLLDSFRQDMHDYIGGIVHDCGTHLLAINSVEDHMHIFLPLPRDVSIAQIMREVKAGSSRWVNQNGHAKSFAWQAGYGAFSVSPSHKKALIQYIKDQEEHHRKVTYQEEYRRLLAKYEVTYNENYIWD